MACKKCRQTIATLKKLKRDSLAQQVEATLAVVESDSLMNSIKWSAKPLAWDAIQTTSFRALPVEVQKLIKKLPKQHFFYTDDIDSPAKVRIHPSAPYVLMVDVSRGSNKTKAIYLARTEGFNYPRYITKLEDLQR